MYTPNCKCNVRQSRYSALCIYLQHRVGMVQRIKNYGLGAHLQSPSLLPVRCTPVQVHVSVATIHIHVNCTSNLSHQHMFTLRSLAIKCPLSPPHPLRKYTVYHSQSKMYVNILVYVPINGLRLSAGTRVVDATVVLEIYLPKFQQ